MKWVISPVGTVCPAGNYTRELKKPPPKNKESSQRNSNNFYCTFLFGLEETVQLFFFFFFYFYDLRQTLKVRSWMKSPRVTDHRSDVHIPFTREI